MIIAITAAGTPELREPDDFKGFKVVIEKPNMPDNEIEAALRGIAYFDAENLNLWFHQGALKNWDGKPRAAEWVASFDAMVEKVKKYGFVDEATGSVRAHIERV
jgi:hypothetical protein